MFKDHQRPTGVSSMSPFANNERRAQENRRGFAPKAKSKAVPCPNYGPRQPGIYPTPSPTKPNPNLLCPNASWAAIAAHVGQDILKVLGAVAIACAGVVLLMLLSNAQKKRTSGGRNYKAILNG